MTRINAHIPPANLCDQHLIAEYREILRTNALANNRADKEGKAMLQKLPKTFTLGNGHVTFFYDKLEYIRLRFNSLRNELLNRGVNAGITYDANSNTRNTWLYNDWAPESAANQMVIDRILERASTMKKITYNGNQITFTEYKNLLNR